MVHRLTILLVVLLSCGLILPSFGNVPPNDPSGITDPDSTGGQDGDAGDDQDGTLDQTEESEPEKKPDDEKESEPEKKDTEADPEKCPGTGCPIVEICCPSSFSYQIPFGRNVNSKLIPDAYLTVHKTQSGPTLVSPSGLQFVSNFNTYVIPEWAAINSDGKEIISSFGNTSGGVAPGGLVLRRAQVKRPNGYFVSYEQKIITNNPRIFSPCFPVGRQQNFSSYLAADENGVIYRMLDSGTKVIFSKQVVLQMPDNQLLAATDREIGLDIVWAEGRVLRQIHSAADGLADVVTLSRFAYEVRIYPHSAIGPKENNLYTVIAEPHTVYRFELHPDLVPAENRSPANYDRILVTNTSRGTIRQEEWTYDANQGGWSVVAGDGLLTRSKYEHWNESLNSLIVDHKTQEQDGSSAFHSREFYKDLGSGPILYKTVLDPDGLALADVIVSDAWGQYKTRQFHDGKWEKYTFTGSSDRVVRGFRSTVLGKLTKGFKNAPFENTELTAEEINDYTPHAAMDTRFSVKPRTVTRKINGITVEKTFYVYSDSGNETIEEKAATPESEYGAAGNLRTVRKTAIKGRMQTITRPDGSQESYTYSFGVYNPTSGEFTVGGSAETAEKMVKTIGTPSSPDGIAGKTKRFVSVLDARGDEVVNEEYVYTGGGYELIYRAVMTYNDHHQVVSRRDSRNGADDVIWRCCGPESVTATTGLQTLFTYDALRRMTSMTKKGHDGQADVTENYTYDAQGRLLRTETVAGELRKVKSSVYDIVGRVLSRTDESGLTTIWSYTNPTETRGRIVTETLPGGTTRIREYYLDGQLKSITGTAQTPEFHDYGADAATSRRWAKVNYGSEDGAVWKKTYTDMLGHKVREERSGYNGAVLVSVYGYDNYGRLIREEHPEQAARLHAYDEVGNRVRSGLDIDGNGQLDPASADRIADTEVGYQMIDGDWFLTVAEKAYGESGSAVAQTLNLRRNRLTGHGAGMLSETIELDRYGNRTVKSETVDRATKTVTQNILHPNSAVAEKIVLVNGLLVSARTRSGLTTQYGYDGLERLISLTSPRIGVRRISYYEGAPGKNGLRRTITDEAGAVTTFDYDPGTGRRTSVKNPLDKFRYTAYNDYGQTTRIWGDTEYPLEFGYDPFGRQISQKTYRNGNWNGPAWPDGASGDLTTWSYDAGSGLVTSKMDAQGKSTNYAYTPAGQLASRTWARPANSLPLTTVYSYDPMTADLLKVDYSDATTDIVYTYNRLGQTATVQDAAGSRSFIYNAYFDRFSETIAGIYGKTLRYDYAETGMKGRPTGFSLDNVPNALYTYDEYGRLNGVNGIAYGRLASSELIENTTRPNGVNTSWSFESNRNLVTQIVHGTVGNYGYTNDVLGHRTSMTRNAELLTYAYNDRSEVTGAVSDTNTVYNYNYNYDPIGNRQSATLAGMGFNYTANALNQYTAINTDTATYDADGNMLTRDGWTQEWNGENRLIRMTKGAQRLEFDYDYMGRRIEKKVYSGESLTKHTRFVYNGYKLIEELDALNANSTLRRYTWQPEELGMDVPLTVTENGMTYFYHTDANKNITELTDADGNAAAYYEYSPFGQQTAATGAYAAINPFRFSSEYFDEETQLIYYNYRYYAPDMGRWLSRDPIEEQGGWNLYGMAGNDPFRGWDELGLGLVDFCKKMFSTKTKTDTTINTGNDPKATPKQKSDAAHDSIGEAARGKNEKRYVEQSKDVTGAALDQLGDNLQKNQTQKNDAYKDEETLRRERQQEQKRERERKQQR